MALAPCFYKDLSKLVAEEDRCLTPTRMSLVWSMTLWEHLVSLESLSILQKQSHALVQVVAKYLVYTRQHKAFFKQWCVEFATIIRRLQTEEPHPSCDHFSSPSSFDSSSLATTTSDCGSSNRSRDSRHSNYSRNSLDSCSGCKWCAQRLKDIEAQILKGYQSLSAYLEQSKEEASVLFGKYDIRG